MRKVCKIPDCERVHYARDLCAGHYKRLRKVILGEPRQVAMGAPIREYGRTRCDVAGCEGRHFSKGWCIMHYRRALRHDGDPEGRYKRRTQTNDMLRLMGYLHCADKDDPDSGPILGPVQWAAQGRQPKLGAKSVVRNAKLYHGCQTEEI